MVEVLVGGALLVFLVISFTGFFLLRCFNVTSNNRKQFSVKIIQGWSSCSKRKTV